MKQQIEKEFVPVYAYDIRAKVQEAMRRIHHNTRKSRERLDDEFRQSALAIGFQQVYVKYGGILIDSEERIGKNKKQEIAILTEICKVLNQYIKHPIEAQDLINYPIPIEEESKEESKEEASVGLEKKAKKKKRKTKADKEATEGDETLLY